jgi:hypothetical protein
MLLLFCCCCINNNKGCFVIAELSSSIENALKTAHKKLERFYGFTLFILTSTAKMPSISIVCCATNNGLQLCTIMTTLFFNRAIYNLQALLNCIAANA